MCSVTFVEWKPFRLPYPCQGDRDIPSISLFFFFLVQCLSSLFFTICLISVFSPQCSHFFLIPFPSFPLFSHECSFIIYLSESNSNLSLSLFAFSETSLPLPFLPISLISLQLLSSHKHTHSRLEDCPLLLNNTSLYSYPLIIPRVLFIRDLPCNPFCCCFFFLLTDVDPDYNLAKYGCAERCISRVSERGCLLDKDIYLLYRVQEGTLEAFLVLRCSTIIIIIIIRWWIGSDRREGRGEKYGKIYWKYGLRQKDRQDRNRDSIRNRHPNR